MCIPLLFNIDPTKTSLSSMTIMDILCFLEMILMRWLIWLMSLLVLEPQCFSQPWYIPHCLFNFMDILHFKLNLFNSLILKILSSHGAQYISQHPAFLCDVSLWPETHAIFRSIHFIGWCLRCILLWLGLIKPVSGDLQNENRLASPGTEPCLFV